MRTSFLIVDDDARGARALRRVLQRYGPTRLATDAASGRRALGELSGVAGIVVDVKLPDGCGLDVAAFARERFGDASILVLTGHNSPATNRSAFQLGANYLQKPAGPDDIDLFAQRALLRDEGRRRNLVEAVEEFVARFQITPRERRIVELLVEGVSSRAQLAEALGVTEHTAKKQVASILSKCGARRVGDVVRQVLVDPGANTL